MKRTGFFESLTSKIILINVIIFVLFTVLSWFLDINLLIENLALSPSFFIHGQKLWTVFTSMFLHIQFWHLFVNMFSLFFIGNFVENLIGKKRFLIFYLLSGIFAGIFWSVLSGFFAVNSVLLSLFGNPEIFGIGASGALFGLIGILAVLTPYARVYLIAGPIIAIILEAITFGIFTKYGLMDIKPYSSVIGIFEIIIIIYFIVAVFSMISFNPKLQKIGIPIELSMWLLPIIAIIPLMIISLFVSLPIGNIAHLGGLIAGLFYAYYLRKKFPKKSKMISKMFK